MSERQIAKWGVDYRYTGLEVAVIGMAGRFPGASDIGEFWDNLVEGIDAISRFTDEELEEAGVSRQLLENERYVRAKGVLPGLDFFDASFFRYSPADARIMDPQVRVLHEETFHALEDAGYCSESRPESIGLFLGATNNLAWEAHTLSRYLKVGPTFAGMQLNDKDFAATRIAYALDLRGPAITLHTACSTSLAAIDVACRNLLTGACQIAVAGGSGLTLPHRNGYLFQESMIHSSDGVCRAFDERAEGTVEGNGVGVVVLKRLDTACRDNDHIYAVIRASATNNDGCRKVGYSAPSVEGQSDVIRKAQRIAQVHPSDISYVETHGTGTRLGDPIEVEALRQAFAGGSTQTNYSCGIGSLKPSIGHLDTAAGVASFIKAVKILEQAVVPASLHFESINPNISLDGTPFHVVGEPEELTRRMHADKLQPLRVGVSSFGIGGTNVHVVLEEAPPNTREKNGRRFNTLTLAAHSADALRASMTRLLDHLSQNPGIDPSDLAWTVQNRQRRERFRYAVEYRDIAQLRERLDQSLQQDEAPIELSQPDRRDICFLFSGLGVQHLRMARELYFNEPDFQQRLDDCFDAALAIGRADLRDLFLGDSAEVEEQLNNIATTQIMLFILEVSMAQQLIAWGVEPTSMIGHSTGEFAAACVAGVFSTRDGIRLIHARGSLMDQTPDGGMMTVKASKEVVKELLCDQLTLAAVNSPEDCSVSGPVNFLNIFERRCVERGISVNRLPAAHAYHSEDMAGILSRFAAVVDSIELHIPKIRYVSNLTGVWITDDQATSSEYYCMHLRSCVQFADGIATILASGDPLFVEVGPGRSLSSFARHCGETRRIVAVNIFRHRLEELPDDEQLAKAIRKLWENGLSLNWHAFHAGRAPDKVFLPQYPFDRTPCPVGIEEFQRHYSGGGTLGQVPSTLAASSPVIIPPHEAGPQHLVWSSSVVSGYAQEKPRTIVALSREPSMLLGILDSIPHWASIPVCVGERYRFDGQRGARVRRGQPEDLVQLVSELKDNALLGDTFLVHLPADDDLAAALMALAQALSEVELTSRPVILFLDEADAAHRSRALVNLLIGLNLQFADVQIASLSVGSPLYLRAGRSSWRSALLTELGAEGLRDIAVRYSEGRRLAAALHPLAWHQRVVSGHGSTLLICDIADTGDVIAMLFGGASADTVQVQPYHLGADRSWPIPTNLPNGVTVLEPVMSTTPEAVASRLRARTSNLPTFDDVVVWDPVSRTNANGISDADRVKLYGSLRQLRATPMPLSFLSPTGLAGAVRWSAQSTTWLVKTVSWDRAVEGVRLFVHADLTGIDDSCLGVLRLMRRFGITEGHLGADLLRMVGEGKSSVRAATVDKGDGTRQHLRDVLAAELAELLGLETIDPAADMFEMGLDSVKLVSFTAALERRGLRVLAPDVYANSSIRELTHFVDSQRGQDSTSAVGSDGIAQSLTESLGVGCTFVPVTAGKERSLLQVLLVDSLDSALRQRCVRALAELDVSPSLLPHYILSASSAAQLTEDPVFDNLRGLLGSSATDLDLLYSEIERGQERLRASIAAQPLRWTYPISGMQRQHFAGEARLQFYLISFNKVLDISLLERALCDVIMRHGMLRSFLTRRMRQFRWREFGPPTHIDLPCLDISALHPDEQDDLVSALVKREWNIDFKVVDKPMYQMFLLKFNEKRYDLVFQFDHSIFDVTSGQILRSDLMRRYNDLLHGAVHAMPVAKSYRHLQDQIDKGPVDISPDEIVEKFELERYVHHVKRIKQRSLQFAEHPIQQTQYSIDLQRIRGAIGQETELFSLVVHLYARLVSRLIGVDHVACDILFQSRVFEGKDYSEVMGMVLGGLPFVIPAARDSREDLLSLIRDKVDMMNRNNISFLNLIHDLRSLIRYRRVAAVTKGVLGPSFRTPCLLNFVGVVEDEYDVIWDMMLAQLSDSQEKLDYADCYCVSKISGDRLSLLLLTRWAGQERITSILDDEIDHLATFNTTMAIRNDER